MSNKRQLPEIDWSNTKHETIFSWRHKEPVTSQLTNLWWWDGGTTCDTPVSRCFYSKRLLLVDDRKIHHILIVINRYLWLVEKRFQTSLEYPYSPFVAGIDLPHQGVVDSYNHTQTETQQSLARDRHPFAAGIDLQPQQSRCSWILHSLMGVPMLQTRCLYTRRSPGYCIKWLNLTHSISVQVLYGKYVER